MSVLEPPITVTSGKALHWHSLHGSSLSLSLAKCAEQAKGPVLIITADNLQAHQLRNECLFFYKNQLDVPPVFVFPDWEILPYDRFSPHQDIISDRLTVLSQLPLLKRGIIIIPITTLMHHLAPSHYLEKNVFVFKVGDKLDPVAFRRRLESAGYYAVSQVMEHGEYSLRGSIIDLYTMGSEFPFRIDLFDDEIETIRSFDPDTQLSIDKINTINLLPAREFPLDDAGITHFRQSWRNTFS